MVTLGANWFDLEKNNKVGIIFGFRAKYGLKYTRKGQIHTCLDFRRSKQSQTCKRFLTNTRKVKSLDNIPKLGGSNCKVKKMQDLAIAQFIKEFNLE